MMERVSSGIPGFDELLKGGIPEKDLVLLTGTCGAGKTIFGLQFLCTVASKEPGIFVSFEEELAQVKDTAKSFGWDVDKLVKSEKLQFLRYDPFKIADIFEIIESNIRDIGAKRVVVDSISSLGLYVKDPPEFRRLILQVSNMLRKNMCTSILISEILPNSRLLSRFGMEEFVADGVVVLHNALVADEYRRGISIWKMRATDHSRKIHPYKITKNGFVVYPHDTITLKGV